MMNKEEYKKEIVRMWDSLRTENKGEYSCYGVDCEFCPLGRRCDRIFSFEMIEAVEKWSKENPPKTPKKFKVSRMEYDLLQTTIHFGSTIDKFYDFCTLSGLFEKGYFEGATGSMYISDYYNNCEVEDNDDN